MPSLIGSALGDNSGVSITQNYLVVKPSSQFGTRQLAFYKITSTGCATNYSNSNSLFQNLVKGVQQTSEIYAVGTPSADNFVVVIASDTDAGQTGAAAYVANTNAQSIQTAVRATSGDGSATVTSLTLTGTGLS